MPSNLVDAFRSFLTGWRPDPVGPTPSPETLLPAEPNPFSVGVPLWVKQTTAAYRAGTPLNTTIAKLAVTHHWNEDQIARLVQESNTQVYLHEDQERTGADHYISFPLASLEGVRQEMGAFANKEIGDPMATPPNPAHAPGPGSRMPKQASAEEEEVDPFWKDEVRTPGLWNHAETQAAGVALLRQKLARRSYEVAREVQGADDAVRSAMDVLTRGLLKVAERQPDALAPLWEYVLQRALPEPAERVATREAFQELITLEKEAQRLPSNFLATLAPYGAQNPHLEYGFAKHAQQVSMPPVRVGPLLLSGPDDLVKVAEALHATQIRLAAAIQAAKPYGARWTQLKEELS